MYWIVYQTTCLRNGKIYVGVHGSPRLDDGYLGSGVELKKDIARFGRDAFKRETLYSFETREEMLAMEAEMVTEEFCFREDTYNVALGASRGVPKAARGSRTLHFKELVGGEWEWFEEQAQALAVPLPDLLRLSAAVGMDRIYRTGLVLDSSELHAKVETHWCQHCEGRGYRDVGTDLMVKRKETKEKRELDLDALLDL